MRAALSRLLPGMVLFVVVQVSCASTDGWQDWVAPLERAVGGTADPGSRDALGRQEVVDGLKQALRLGTERAIGGLGREGGFLDDAEVRIPLPETFASIEKGLRAVGQEQITEKFRATLNRAAESAVPKTAEIFGDTIRGMSLEDGMALLTGADDAATVYFRQNAEPALSDAILPIVKNATAEVGVTSAYKAFVGRAGFLTRVLSAESLDIDRYVTERALDGLFLKLASEEKKIRENPVARTTELLERVFGSRAAVH